MSPEDPDYTVPPIYYGTTVSGYNVFYKDECRIAKEEEPMESLVREGVK